MSGDDLDKARDEIARLNDQAEKNAAAHRADRERLDEALTAESRAWATVHAMRHDLARFNDDAREWGAELGKAMRERDEARAEATRQTDRLMQSEELTDQLHKERDEARAEVERLKESVANLDVLYVSRTDALRESEAEVERLRGIVEVNDRRLAAVWDEARAEVERLKALLEKKAMSPKLEWGPDEGKMTWDDAVKLAASKGDGWRLPTVAELVSQYDYEADRPKNDDWQGWYWSSSPSGGSSAWLVHFDHGNVSTNYRSFEEGVRCVREAGSILTDRPIDESRARYAAELRALAYRIERGRP